jgi:hypothetical protein
MGGWGCTLREQCPHYTAEAGEPAERLCVRGQDGVRLVRADAFRVVHVSVFTGRSVAQPERASA